MNMRINGAWTGSTRFVAAAALLGAMTAARHADAQPLPITVVVKDGDTPAGAPGAVTSLDTPITNGLGQVGFVGVAAGVTFVWFNTGIVWLNTDATTHTLTNGSFDRMGVSDTGGFAYAPLADSLDSLWTHTGLMFLEGDPAPTMTSFPLSAIGEPMMLPNGDIWWLGGVDTDADGFTEVEVIYATPAGMPGNTVAIAAGGTAVGTFTWDDFAFDDTDWMPSKNGAHHIIDGFNNSSSTADDGILVVDGAVVVQEGQSTGGSDFFTFVDDVSINDTGNYVFAGDTDGATEFDEYIAYNGTIVVREGDQLAGAPVTFTVGGISINNLGHVAFIWSQPGFIASVETLYRACNAADIPNTTDIIAFDEQLVDFNNDGIADGAISDFVNGSPALHLGDDGWLYAEVTIDVGPTIDEAIVRFDVACCGDGNIGGNEACDDSGESATCNADCTTASCGDFVINITAGEDCDEGGTETLVCNTDCTFAVCGDGVLNTTSSEACDDGGESATCDVDCTPAECGDGLLNPTAGEACEDGNMDDGDGCSSTCQFEGAGQGGAGGGTGGMGGGTGGSTTSTGGAATSGPGVGGGGATSGPSATTGGSTPPVEDDGGCGCKLPGGDDGNEPWPLWALALGALTAVSRRRRWRR
jgi:MYXO-CTERM domain-containing protein